MSEFSPDYTAAETGLDRFISFKKNTDFIGRSAAEAERQNGTVRKLVSFEVDALDSDVQGYEPIWLDGTVVGFCTSGGYSHHAGKSVALGFLPTERIMDGLAVEIEILGQMRPARMIIEPLFDADGARMRG
jgi:dimethylglycine dehydrogenase